MVTDDDSVRPLEVQKSNTPLGKRRELSNSDDTTPELHKEPFSHAHQTHQISISLDSSGSAHSCKNIDGRVGARAPHNALYNVQTFTRQILISRNESQGVIHQSLGATLPNSGI